MVIVESPVRVRAARLLVQVRRTVILAFSAALHDLSKAGVSGPSPPLLGDRRDGGWRDLSYVCVVVRAGAGGLLRAAGDEVLARVTALLQQSAALFQADRDAYVVGHSCAASFVVVVRDAPDSFVLVEKRMEERERALGFRAPSYDGEGNGRAPSEARLATICNAPPRRVLICRVAGVIFWV